MDPEGIDVLKPRLSWIVESETRGDKQIAYHVLVASTVPNLDSDIGDIWDTGRIESDQTFNIVYDGKALESRMDCAWKVRVWDASGSASAWSEVATWSMGLLSMQDWTARWIGAPKKKKRIGHMFFPKKEMDPSPMLRKVFFIEKPINGAILFASALGEYEISINGSRVGDRVLAPEWTDYLSRVQYQAYDVTEFLCSGENVIGAMLGDGWYIGNTGFFFVKPRIYGANRRLLVQLEVEFDDKTTEHVCSDGMWKIWEDGPIRRADHFLGEIYDIRKEIPGWNSPGYDDTGWNPVIIDDAANVHLVAQMNEPIRILEEIEPISSKELKPGTFLYDLGQNIAGWCKVRLDGMICDANATVTLRHGEMLDLDGSLFTANLKSASAKDEYVYDGTTCREFQPHFTYHGFQFIEVSGLKAGARPPRDFIIGCAIATSAQAVSSFESSDATLNKLWRNIVWTLRDNIMSVPTDCPQRSERLGWMGDVQVFNQTSMFLLDMAAFYTKWMEDIRDAQFKDGRFSDFSPRPHTGNGFFIKAVRGSPGWADCGVMLPWNIYLNYADARQLEKHYPFAKKYVDQVYSRNKGLLWKSDTSVNYGDWLNGDRIRSREYPKKGAALAKVIHATAFFAHSTELLSRMALVLGNAEDAARYSDLAARIKEAFCKAFVDQEWHINGDTQAGYAIALNFDILPEDARPDAAKHLVAALERYENRLSTGFNSTSRMMLELARWGHVEVAYFLLFSKRFPSWFYMIDQGATTMWERWDSFVKGRGFQSKTMNSFNHYAYGSVGEFIYRVILGINPDESKPGYEHFFIMPRLGKQLSHVKGRVNTIRGTIESEWSVSGGQLDLHVSIPANTTATVHVPAFEGTEIRESGNSLEDVDGIQELGREDGVAELLVSGGSYHFTSRIE